MEKVKISIITPCYNSEKTIERTIESVLNQTYDNFEYIIIDGSSSDGTMNMVKKYHRDSQKKMKYLSEPDKGIYDAINKGIKLSTGELIGIVNSDDWYENNALEKVVNEYQKDKYQVIYGMLRVFDKGDFCQIYINNHKFLPYQMITHPTCFISKNVYNDFGSYSLDYKSASDYDFLLRLYQTNKVCFSPIFEILSNFSLGGISSSNIGKKETLSVLFEKGYISRKRYVTRNILLKFSDLLRFINSIRKYK